MKATPTATGRLPPLRLFSTLQTENLKSMGTVALFLGTLVGHRLNVLRCCRSVQYLHGVNSVG